MNNDQNIYTLENKKLLNLALLLILVLSLLVLVSLYISKGVRTDTPGTFVEVQNDPFKDASLIARAAIVYDIANSKVVYSKNLNDVLPIASITKLLTAVTAVELLPKSTVVTVKKEFLAEEGDSGLRSDQKWDLTDLIDYSLMVSSNDGAAAIAGAAGAFKTQVDPSTISRKEFISDMNAEAKKIGMKSSNFFNETGLDVSKEQAGGYSTVEDLATLFAYILKNHPDIFSATKYPNLSFTSLDNLRYNAQNTDIIIDNLPAVLGSKTGYTELAGGNLGIVFNAGLQRPMAVIVLGSTFNGRFTDVEDLVKKTLVYVGQGN